MSLIEAISSNNLEQIRIQIRAPLPENISYGSPLHLAIAFAKIDTFSFILTEFYSSCTLWINSLNAQGDTPLLLAVKLDRSDVINQLFKFDIDDTLGNPLNIAKDLIKSLLLSHQSAFVKESMSNLNILLMSNPDAIPEFFKTIRSQAYLSHGLIDLNAPIDSNESTLLHGAARLELHDLVLWLIKNGADPNVHNKKGKKPRDLVSKSNAKLICLEIWYFYF